MFWKANGKQPTSWQIAGRIFLALAAGLLSSSLFDAAALAQSAATTPKAPPLNSSLQNGAEWCAQYRFGQLKPKERMVEPNRRRLAAAQTELAPEFLPGKSADGILLLANYQQEMETVHPDRVLAATYLALASAVPIDVKLVERVNSLLCVSASSAVAKGVALIADAEWRQMSR